MIFFKQEKILMKYYVNVLYMIVNGVIILKDKNKIFVGNGIKIIKKGNGMVKKANGLKSVKGSGLRILK